MYKHSQETCVSRYGVSTKQNRNVVKNIFADLLRCIVDCINHICMYFVCANAVNTIAEVGVVFLSAKRKMLKNLFLLAYVGIQLILLIIFTYTVYVQIQSI